MKPKKYICPICKNTMSHIRYTDESKCEGVTVKCSKCGNIVEIRLPIEGEIYDKRTSIRET